MTTVPMRRDRPGGRFRRATTVLAGTALATVGLVLAAPAAYADPPAALPQNATAGDLKWQPALDYDTDGCYPTPAIGPDGSVAPGLPKGGAKNGACRDASDLDNTNAYVRTACQGDWCAHKYALYFEKDQTQLGGGSAGHTHDWEHIVVWVQNDEAKFVSVSQHGNYETRPTSDVRFEGTGPKIVYHQDGQSTHTFRFAEAADEPPENHKGTWQRPALLTWDLLDPGIRDTLANHDFDSATLALKDSEFGTDLAKAKPAEVPFDTGRV